MATIKILSGNRSQSSLKKEFYRLARNEGQDIKLKLVTDYQEEDSIEYGKHDLNIDYYIILDQMPSDPLNYYEPSRTIVFRNLLNTPNDSPINSTILDQSFGILDPNKFMAIVDNCPRQYMLFRSEKIIKENRSSIKLDKIICITLEDATERQQRIKEELENQDLEVFFYYVQKHTNPRFGCLTSHLEVLKMAKKENWDNVLILEDDCHFVRSFQIPQPPDDWEMLYLGSAVNTLLEKHNQNWNRVCAWLTHAYIVNYKIISILIQQIETLAGPTGMAIDEFYCRVIHPQYRCYAVYPTIAIQVEGYSQIEKIQLNRVPQIEAADKVINSNIKKPDWLGDIFYIESPDLGFDERQAVKKTFTKKNLEYREIVSLEAGLRLAIKRNLKNVLILKGEILFGKSPYKLYYHPLDWDILYLGNNDESSQNPETKKLLNDGKKGKRLPLDKLWNKMDSNDMVDTFAVVINNNMFEKILNDLEAKHYPSFSFYLKELIHSNYNCYKSFEEYVYNKVLLFDHNEDKDKIVDNEKLPNISIVTPTGNREKLFKMAIVNFLATNYPADKIEWIIVDDGENEISSILPKDSRIKYHYINQQTKEELYNALKQQTNNLYQQCNKMKKDERKKIKLAHTYFETIYKEQFHDWRLPIGMKRNIGVNYASNPVIVHMDDDDYYPPQSILFRVSKLLQEQEHKPSIGCVGSTTIANFDINKYISTINIPPPHLPLAKRISEATLVYTKAFWNKRKFNNCVIGSEGEFFIDQRENKFVELDYYDYENKIIVALNHSKNLTRANRPNSQPNGWHFGEISEELFKFITSLDEEKTDNKDKNIESEEDQTNKSDQNLITETEKGLQINLNEEKEENLSEVRERINQADKMIYKGKNMDPKEYFKLSKEELEIDLKSFTLDKNELNIPLKKF